MLNQKRVLKDQSINLRQYEDIIPIDGPPYTFFQICSKLLILEPDRALYYYAKCSMTKS